MKLEATIDVFLNKSSRGKAITWERECIPLPNMGLAKRAAVILPGSSARVV